MSMCIYIYIYIHTHIYTISYNITLYYIVSQRNAADAVLRSRSLREDGQTVARNVVLAIRGSAPAACGLHPRL